MYVSKYTFVIPHHNRIYLYNTLSNALLEINQESYSLIREAKINNNSIDIEKLDADVYTILKDKHFIVENDYDELLLYKSIILSQREQTEFMHLTLAPTMECNFNCFYCFETEKPKGKMLERTMENIIRYIQTMKNLKRLYLTWFGGEPLIAQDEMEKFYNKLISVYGNEYESNIITTGYFIDKATIELLQRIKVKSVQITLDGPRDIHNKIKRSDDCIDVFERVLSNVDLLTNIAPDIDVAFRINLTKRNVTSYKELYFELLNRYKGKQVVVVPAFVDDRTSFSTNNTICLNRQEKVDFILDLWNKNGIYTNFLDYPTSSCNECAIRDKMSIGFDSEGYAYKCWETLGKRKYAIGNLQDDGMIGDINYVMLNRQLYGADIFEDKECLACEYLPICHGGCPIERIENRISGKKNDVCTFYKGYMEEFIKIHIDILGLTNK